MKYRYLKIELDRLYNGFIADARSYQVEKAIRNGWGVKFYIKPTGRYITISPDRVKEGIYGTRLFKSKQHKGKDYFLVSFSVRSDVEKAKEKEPEQLSVMKLGLSLEQVRGLRQAIR